MNNKEIIFELVKKHFAFSEEGLKKFQNYLFNPFIDETYKKIIKDDLRARFPVDGFDCSRFDEGWQLFRNWFASFIVRFNVKYENFFNNKITIDKNERKLVKFMEEYYLNRLPINEACHEFGIYRYTSDNEDHYRKQIKKMFDDRMNQVGANKLSKGKLEIVFTLDFADWFLCSTGEKWTSCISLDSDYDGNYWSGLPGLVGDKNRAMIYLTDGAQKNYCDIKVDRFLARSWVLLSDKNEMQIVRFYPNSLIKTSEINKITKLTFNHEDEIIRNFQSKYPIDLIKYENGNSAGVFQDSFGLCGDLYLRFGHHGYNHIAPNGEVTDSRIFNWRGAGLKGLISQGKSLAGCEDHGFECGNCGRALDEDHIYYGPNGDDAYCEHCYNENYFSCNDCGETYSKEHEFADKDGNCFCEECYHERYTECFCCSEEVSLKGAHSYHEDPKGNIVCEKCFYEKYATCSSCGKSVGNVKDKVKTKTGHIYCYACACEKDIKLHRERE